MVRMPAEPSRATEASNPCDGCRVPSVDRPLTHSHPRFEPWRIAVMKYVTLVVAAAAMALATPALARTRT